MPKEVWKIDQFHGGLNSNSDARDIADNELAFLEELMVDRVGLIRTMGTTAVHDEVTTHGAYPHPSDNAGHGLFIFSHDRIGGNLATEHLSDIQNFTDDFQTMSDMLSSNQKTALADALDGDNDEFDFATGTTNLVVSNGFTAANSATFVNSSAVGQLSNGAASVGIVTLPIITLPNRTYQVEFDVTAINTAQVNVSLGTDEDYNSSNKVTSSGAATGLTLDVPYYANDTSSFLALQLTTSTSGHWVKIDNLKITLLSWDVTGDFSVNSTDATYTHSSGTGTLIQTADNRAIEGIANIQYSLTYTISSFSNSSITAFRIKGSGSQFAAANTDLEQSDGTHTTTFTSHATDPDQPFTIEVTSDGTASFNIDNISLYITDESGDDYLVMADVANANLDIFSKNLEAWGTGIIDLGTTIDMVPVFYVVDGSLRVSDGAFGANNETMWYGYIQRRFFGDGTSGYDGTGHTNGILKSKWHSDEAAPKALPLIWLPNPYQTETLGSDSYPVSIYLQGLSGSTTPGSATFTQTGTATAGITDNVISADVTWATSKRIAEESSNGDRGFDNFCSIGDRIEVSSADVTSNNRMYTVTAVTDNYIDVEEATDTDDESDFIYIYNLSRSGWYGGDGHDGWEVGMTTLYDDNKQESSILKWELTGAHDSGADSDTVMTDAGTKSNGLASFPQVTSGNLIGFVCKNLTDGSQGIIIANDANTVTLDDLTGGSDNSWDAGDLYSISIIRPKAVQIASTNISQIRLRGQVFAGDGINDGLSVTHPRVSGFKIYMRWENTDTWYLQAEIDVTKGMKSAGIGSYQMWEPDESIGTSTKIAYAYGEYKSELRQVETYESETGFSAEYSDVGFSGTGTGFKTAVIANRMVYVGNVKITDKQGNTAVHGDAVLKSAVNKFDSFTLDRMIEVSINDGDNIVKLEEYADRLLIFKKKKMELVNISQEVEFLEDTFMYKGVNHPAAVCKTDFGIAWVNAIGVYLYDGQKVHNLLEKKGVRVISAYDWETWADESPVIGYFSKKRHLIIRQDTGAASDDGDIYVYDIVTQSWSLGYDLIPISDSTASVTNFVNDWNGDLIISQSSGSNSIVVKWVDDLHYGTVSSANNVMLRTKDIDFGHPGVRKKVYRVHISYRGNAASLNVRYLTNQDISGAYKNFERINTDGTPTGTEDTTPLLNATANQWYHAELKPATPSEANNIYSFQIHMNGTAHSDFEINDISIVYRLKGVK